MTTGLTVPPAAVLAGVLLLLAVSPVLAGWSAALAGDRAADTGRWWRWRQVSRSRLATVAAVAVVLGLAATAGRPWPAWWLFAAGGAVLVVVDAQVHLLPARLVYPLGAAIAVSLVATAAATGQWDRLLRALLATAAVTAAWLAIAVAAPTAFGLGDVRLFALTGGLLGWDSWTAVLYAEMAAFLFAGLTAVIAAVRSPRSSRRTARVPMGPAIIAGALAATWLSS
jgi:leader peptidase (prepilin peptidase)/N-methyltransferase